MCFRVVHKLSSNFRDATKIVTVPYDLPVKPGHILIKYLHVGINASDVSSSDLILTYSIFFVLEVNAVI